MVFAPLFLLVTTWLGALISFRSRALRGLAEKTGVAMAIGLMIQMWLPFIVSKSLGIGAGPGVALGICVLVLLFCLKEFPELDWSNTASLLLPGPPRLAGLVLGASSGFLGWMFYTHSLQPTPEGLSSAGVCWEDQSFHAMLASSFLYSDNLITLNYPHFEGWPLGYPFLPDLLAATLVRLGATLSQAFSWSAWYAGSAFILLIWSLTRAWFKETNTATLALILFLCAGGLGFLDFINESKAGLHWPDLLMKHDYVNGWELGLHYHNPLTGVMLPMRTSLFGMPVALALLLLIVRLVENKESFRRDWLTLGILTGLLPLVHAHSFLVVVVCGTVYSLIFLVPQRFMQVEGENALLNPTPNLNPNLSFWLQAGIKIKRKIMFSSFRLMDMPPSYFLLAIIPLALIALPQIAWTHRQMAISNPPFIRMHIGWMCDAQTLGGWLRYWLHNGGVRLPLGLFAWGIASVRIKKWTAPLLGLLILGNVMVFQPFTYDNIKLFVFTDIAIAGLTAHLIMIGWKKSIGTRGILEKAVNTTEFTENPEIKTLTNTKNFTLCGNRFVFINSKNSVCSVPSVVLTAGLRLILILLVFLLTASGILSIWRETRLHSLVVDNEGIAFAELVKEYSSPRAVFLTGSALTHPVAVLAGRSLVMGYMGGLSLHGIPSQTREPEVKEMFTGGDKARELLQKYKVEYVVIGPAERREFPQLNEPFFATESRAKYQKGSYSLYELKKN